MKSMASPLKLLANADGIPRKDELLQFLDTVQGNGDRFEGTKYFDSLAVLTHKKNGMYIGIRGRRSGILGAEKCNEESVLAYNMSYGTVSCVMQSGKEYYNISPVWDYAKIPGTTARAESDDELLAHEKWSETLESPCKTRGAVEGDIGILTEYCEHDGVSLNATFFTFDGSLVALGADIKVDDGAEVYTTVEQCIADSVIIGDSTVINGDVIYKNLDERCEFLTTAQAVAGDWKRNSRFMNSTPDIADVLTVVIPNTTGGSYAYLVTNDEENTVKVVSNDSYCQAIELGDGKVLAAFHEDFELAIGERKICGKAGDFIFG